MYSNVIDEESIRPGIPHALNSGKYLFTGQGVFISGSNVEATYKGELKKNLEDRNSSAVEKLLEENLKNNHAGSVNDHSPAKRHSNGLIGNKPSGKGDPYQGLKPGFDKSIIDSLRSELEGNVKDLYISSSTLHGQQLIHLRKTSVELNAKDCVVKVTYVIEAH